MRCFRIIVVVVVVVLLSAAAAAATYYQSSAEECARLYRHFPVCLDTTVPAKFILFFEVSVPHVQVLYYTLHLSGVNRCKPIGIYNKVADY